MNNTYQEAIENSNIVSKTDINGIITFVNDEFCKISGYSYDELIGQNHNIQMFLIQILKLFGKPYLQKNHSKQL